MADLAHNKSKSYRWRTVVSLVLTTMGVLAVDGEVVRPKRERRVRLSEYFAGPEDEPERGDIEGLRRFVINTRDQSKRDLSGALDEAHADAQHDGKQFYAVVFTRPGRDPREGYVLTRLDVFGSMVAELENKA